MFPTAYREGHPVIRQNRFKNTVWAELDKSGHVVEWELSDSGWYDGFVWVDGRRYRKSQAYEKFISGEKI